MKIFITLPALEIYMPPSMPLKGFGALTALAIASAALLFSPVEPPSDVYTVTVKLAAGTFVIIGSLCLSYAVGGTFLRAGGRGAFKALYWASFAGAGAGIAEAASGFVAASVPLAVALAALAYAGAGLMLSYYAGGG